MRILTRILHEPLIHFIAIGALLFLVHGVMNNSTESKTSRTISISRGQVDQLKVGFMRTWRRPPSPDELNGMLQDFIREEVFVREALALGLDVDDTIVRRRLRQKIEFLSQDTASIAEPSDEDLENLLKSDQRKFRNDPKLSFRQIFFKGQRSRADLARIVTQTKSRLTHRPRNLEESKLGDPSMLPHLTDGLPFSEIAKQWGDAFAQELSDLPLHQWQGPIESPYGQHLVLIMQRTDGTVPEFSKIRDNLRKEWQEVARHQANDAYYNKLRDQYAIVVEGKL